MKIEKILLPIISLFTLTCSFVSFNQDSSLTLAKENEINVDDLSNESCTFMYVGKQVSEDGLAIIARTGDSKPLTYHSFNIVNTNEYANKTIEGYKGFTWIMPDHTYKYIGTPRSSTMANSNYWEVSTMNEVGLAVSATLSCRSDENRVLKYDNFVPTGIGEDNIAGILAATCSTAKDAVLYLGRIIDEKGSCEANAIMTLDKDEAWYMEIYSGHQYCAIKLPDDKACTIGNEFMLNSLSEFNESDYITSANLFSLPKEKGFAQYIEGFSDDKHMHLFNTYATPLTDATDNGRITTDASHRRTWRGINLFAKSDEQVPYSSTTKYNSFFTPKRKLSNDDVYFFMRDRFEDLLSNPSSEYDLFREDLKNGMLRYVGYETAYNIHSFKVHNDLPKNMSVEAWICLGNSKYSPFVPFTNSLEVVPPMYSHVTKEYGPDEDSALFLYRKINGIANLYPNEYGKPITRFWNNWENIWKEILNQCLNKCKEYISQNRGSDAQLILNSYLYFAQCQALNEADFLYEDLLARFLSDQKSYKPSVAIFKPKSEISYIGSLYGYKSSIKDNVITLTKDNKEIKIELGNGQINSLGKITLENNSRDIETYSYEGIYYAELDVLLDYVSYGEQIVQINFDSFIPQKNNGLFVFWLIPLLVVIVVIGLLIFILVLKKKRND